MIPISRVDRVLELIWVVAAKEYAGLKLELQTPMSFLGERQDIAGSDATAQCFAFPASLAVQTDAENTYLAICLKVESLKGSSLSFGTKFYVALAEVLACLHLVVANLEILVGIVALPPGAIERCTIGEMATKRIILDSNVGNRTPPVVTSGHVGSVEE